MRSIIIGAGKYGEVYLSYLQEIGVNIIGFIDDTPEKQNTYFHNLPILGTIDILPHLRHSHKIESVYCPLGNNIMRVKYLEYARTCGFKTPNFIHENALISPAVNIKSDSGVYILGNTCVMPYVTIHEYVMISVGSNIIHHSTLHQGVFISNGVNVGACVNVHKRAYVGMGSTIKSEVKNIGKDSLIGAGAVVIHDVQDNAVVAGVPAKILKIKNEEDMGDGVDKL